MDEWSSGDSSGSKYIQCTGNVEQKCNPVTDICIFHLQVDQCEQRNLRNVEQYNNYIEDFYVTLAEFNKSVKYTMSLTSDPNGNPANFNNAWKPWIDDTTNNATVLSYSPYFIICLLLALYVTEHR